MAWKTVSGSSIIRTGNTYRATALIQRTSGNSSDDDVIHALETQWSYTKLEDDLESQFGTSVTVNSVTARKKSNNLYEQTIEFTCAEAHSITLATALGYVVIFIVIPGIIAWLLMDKFEHFAEGASDTFEEFTERQQNWILIATVVVFIFLILMAIKK